MFSEILEEKIFKLDIASSREKAMRTMSIVFIVLLFIVLPITGKIIYEKSLHYDAHTAGPEICSLILIPVILYSSFFFIIVFVSKNEDRLIVDIPENVIWMCRRTFSREKKSFYCSINDIKKISLISKKKYEKKK